MPRLSLQKRAAQACGRSRCDGCPNLFINGKHGDPHICDICMASYVKGYIKCHKDEVKFKNK